MTTFKTTATVLAALALAGCATPPPVVTHTFAILTLTDDPARVDKTAVDALQAHPQWLPQYGEMRRLTVETISHQLTRDPPRWRAVPAVDVSLAAIVAKQRDDGDMFTDASGAPRREVGELLERLGVDAVFVVTERALSKTPSLVPREAGEADPDADVVAFERVAVDLFDRTRVPGKEAIRSWMIVPIVDSQTPGARATRLNDADTHRRGLEELIRQQGY